MHEHPAEEVAAEQDQERCAEAEGRFERLGKTLREAHEVGRRSVLVLLDRGGELRFEAIRIE